ncbi:restriction endonuclease subunit S [Xanthomonas sacchari]
MSELPAGWVSASIGEICSQGEQRIPEADEQFTYIDIASVDRGRKTVMGPQLLRGYEAPSRARKVVATGDVIVSMTRPNLNAVALIGQRHDSAIASTGFDVLRPIEVDPRWIFAAVKSAHFVKAMSAKVQGALYPAIKADDIRKHEIPLPPLAEQKRIAQKLDALLAQVDTLKARIDAIPALLKRFRQSVLSAALNGQLTIDFVERSCNSETLMTQLKEDHAAAGGHARGNASQPVEEAHDLTQEKIPGHWRVGELRDLCEPGRPITYGILKPGPELEVGIPYIRVADFPGNKLNPATIKNTSEEIDFAYRRARLKAGDLLLSIRGSVGRLIKIPAELEGANITQDTARLSISGRVSVDFVHLALRAEDTQRRMRAATRGVAVRGINIGDVRALQIPVPGMDEQAEIVRRVEQLFAYADQLEAKVAAAQQRIDALTQSLLAKAFRGELVPQDPTDEPASVLLERIRTQRAAAPKPKRGRKAATS